MNASISIDKEKIAEFCKARHIKWMALFGSVLREDFRPDSDIDVVVVFEEGKTPGWDFFTMHEELEEMFGHKVDFNTPGFLSRYFRDDVMKEAETVYEER